MKIEAHTQRTEQLRFLTTGGALVIAFVLLMAYQFVNGRQQLFEELRTEAAIIGANSSAALVFEDEKAALEILSAIRLTPRIIGGALYRMAGDQLASVSTSDATFPKNIANNDDDDSTTSWAIHTGLFGGVMREKVLQDESRVGTLLLIVDYSSLYWEMLAYAVSVLIIGAIALLIAYHFTASLRKRMTLTEEQLEQMAFHDRITGLPNRRFFIQELKKTVTWVKRERKSAALLFIDVDNFKKVNDLCGHQEGDRVLVMIAQRLKDKIRAADIIARAGGDEFVVLLNGIGTPEKAAKIAEHMISAIAEPFPTEPIPSHVGLSIGISMLPNDSDDPDSLLRWSEMSMYVAKSQGRNRYQFYSEEINNRVHGDLRIEAELRKALKNQEGGLWVAYQPQVCAKTRKLVGVEALARWQLPTGASVSPGEFIPVAEKSGLISDLGVWITTRVCKDLAELKRAGIDLPKVAVNVSPRELTHGDAIVDGICGIIERYGLSRDCFQFEVTENALMNDQGSDVLDAFRTAGFSLAIDDFGSGYSSLGYLKRFRVSTLKIDRQFVQNLPHDSDDAAIVSAVIQMSRALGISVVAEGVETEQQAGFLAEHGCDTLQGFLISRPIPPAELIAFVHKQG